MPSRLPDPRLDDPTLDDWLGEQGEVDWGDDRDLGPSRDSTGGATARAPAERGEMTPVAGGPARSSTAARRLAAVRRRRGIALAALFALALAGVGLALTVLRDDEPTAPTTAPVVATPPPSAEPPAAPPAATTVPPEETTAPLTIELPASGPLALGARGEEVETLQAALAALQLDPGEADGFFGETTKEAVIAFQQANDLPADGIVGPSTVSKLNAALADAGVTG